MPYRLRSILSIVILGWSLIAATPVVADQPLWVAFGDSITVGIEASTPTLSYIGRLQSVLGPIQNAAVSATTIAQQLPLIQAYTGTATHVIWLTGYNDTRAGTDLLTYQLLLDHALQELTTHGKTVFLGLCLPMTAEGYQAYGPLWNHGSDEQVQRLNMIIRQTAEAYPTVHVVAMSIYQPESDVAPDLVHPNDRGHQQIAAAFLARIFPHVWLPIIFGAPIKGAPPNIRVQPTR